MNDKKINPLALSKEILGGGISLRIPTVGISMHPMIRAGDIIVVESARVDDISIGDIVLYCLGEKMVAHRVIRRRVENGKMVLVTKGDSCPNFDKPVFPEHVIGKVITIQKKEREVRLDTNLGRLINLFWVMVSFLRR